MPQESPLLLSFRRKLDASPHPALSPPPAVEEALSESVRYLDSEAAISSLAADTYWPKWDSPWWHMLLLLEIGAASRIPARAVTKLVDGLNGLPLRIFPIRPGDLPAGLNL